MVTLQILSTTRLTFCVITGTSAKVSGVSAIVSEILPGGEPLTHERIGCVGASSFTFNQSNMVHDASYLLPRTCRLMPVGSADT